MMPATALPDCPSCAAHDTLRCLYRLPRTPIPIRICWCAVCAQTCRVTDAGTLDPPPADTRDVSGHVIDGD